MRSWLSRNRWGLVALPFAIVLAVAGNGYRLQDWLHQDEVFVLRSAHGHEGGWVRFSDSFVDGAGKHRRKLTFRVRSVKRVDSVDDGFVTTKITNPAYDVYRVTLDLRADPSTVLQGCTIGLTDGHGNRFDYLPHVDGLSLDASPCLDPDREGPQAVVAGLRGGLPAGEEPRRPAWTRSPVVFVPHGAHISGLRLWFEPPRYAEVSVRPSA